MQMSVVTIMEAVLRSAITLLAIVTAAAIRAMYWMMMERHVMVSFFMSYHLDKLSHFFIKVQESSKLFFVALH